MGFGTIPIKTPSKQGAGASAQVASAEPVMTLIQIREPILDHAGTKARIISSRGLEKPDPNLLVVSPDPTPAFDISTPSEEKPKEERLTEASGNSVGHAVLFGRYVGQITERVLRTWIRPRSQLQEPLFQCGVSITQSPSGEVLNVALQTCNGNVHWQRSLIDAIQRASPLPAPPDPSVFSSTVAMTFNATPLGRQGDDPGYEPGSSLAEAEPVEQDLPTGPVRIVGGNWVLNINGAGRPGWTRTDLQK